MEKDHIDASLGLAFSLRVFEQYRRNGLLQADGLHHVSGIRGRCTGVIQLVEGKVTACYVEQDGKRYPKTKEELILLDDARGPFPWKLQPIPAPPMQRSDDVLSAQPEPKPPVPRRITELNLDRLVGWTSTQKLMLSVVYDSIDGKKNIEAIKKVVPLPSATTEEALRVLVALRVIIMITRVDNEQNPQSFFHD